MRPVRAADRRLPNGSLLRVTPDYGRRLILELNRRWAMVTAHAFEDGQIVLRGELHGFGGTQLRLELLREEGLPTLEYPIVVAADNSFTVTVPPGDLLGEGADELGGDDDDEDAEQGVRWQLMLLAGRRRERIALAADTPVAAWPVAGIEVALHRSFTGHGALVARRAEPVLTDARWIADGTLVLTGVRGAWSGPMELVLHSPKNGVQHAFAATETPGGGFAAELRPAAIATLAGPMPMRRGAWHLCARPAGATDVAQLAPVVVARPLLGDLPRATVIGHKPFSLGAMAGDRALLTVERDLGEDERGAFHQRRLMASSYTARRTEPLRDAVVYASFGGRQASDSPRAILAELQRRGAALEHLWVVHDAMVAPPAGATALRTGSPEYHEALATARYIVANDHFPDFLERRDDQRCLQTWHGTPAKHVGLDIVSTAPTQRRFDSGALRSPANWQHVLSANPFTTPILRRAYGLDGEIHETGLPRNDVLAAAGREERSRAVRERLGIAAGVRVVLYAPTFRDHVIDRRGRPRLDLHLDAQRLRDALGADTVVLFRKHHLVVDPVPATPDGFVRDVSTFPDANELMLAADVLVTDYSAMMFDFAITGRPMAFFAYDLETYRDEVRGLYLDLEAEAPGPVVRTTDALAEALSDLEGLRAGHADRYAAFATRFCALEDGGAAARAADLLVGPERA
jgi:CDP-glycerol glycerophosphotransferase